MFFFDRSETQAEYREALGSRISASVDKAKKNDASKTKTAVADAAGVTAEQLNKWIKGTVKVPVDALRSLASFTDTDFSWLVTGGNSAAQLPASTSSFAFLPFYEDVEAAAGHGAAVIADAAHSVIGFARDLLRESGASPQTCTVIRAKGDSMSPTIPDGALLVVDHSQREIANGYITVIGIGEDILVKRVRRRLDGLIDLISDNRAYEPETLGPAALQQLRVIGRVVYFCRTP